jgi:hypothetical protein
MMPNFVSPSFLPVTRRALAGLAAFWLAGLPMGAWATPVLSCQVSYAGTTHTVQARPVEDPYPVPSVDIGGRFWFKAVMVGNDKQVQRILLYTYLDALPHPVLVHQAKYLPPFVAPRSKVGAMALTGQHYIYAGAVERELIYSCTLAGVKP